MAIARSDTAASWSTSTFPQYAKLAGGADTDVVVVGGGITGLTTVCEAAAQRGVAVEIDGEPSRQDVDFTLGRQALPFGCMFALESDAHTTGQLSSAETALAHARLAAIPADRIVNCWPLERPLARLSDPSSEYRR